MVSSDRASARKCSINGLDKKATDIDLIQKAKRGDTQAFEALIKEHEAKIFNLIISMTADRTESYDLFQDTFVNAWKNLNSFRGSAKFSTWLYRIAVNSVLMKRRKRNIRTVSIDVPPSEEEDEKKGFLSSDKTDNPLVSLEREELEKRVKRSIRLLPEKYRIVLVLIDVQGLPATEVKSILNLSLSGVKSRLRRARILLRERLANYFKI